MRSTVRGPGVWWYVVRMALKELGGEWPVSIALCLAVTAVAAPLLVLGGLHNGVIGGILGGLRDDPGARLIRLQATGSARFGPDWFAEVGAWPEVGFLSPATRWAATQVEVFDPSGHREARASLLPTAPGDPILAPEAPPIRATKEVAISADLARALDVAEGGGVLVEVTRKLNGLGQSVAVPLTVVSVAPAANFARNGIFLSLDLLEQIENYKDGFGAPLLGVDGKQAPPRTHYPDFRLYARSVDTVMGLMERLGAAPYSLSLQAETGRIGFAMALDRNLGLVIAAVGGLGVFGLFGGVAAIQWSMAARRRRTIAILGLIGYRRGNLIALPVIQASALGLLGTLGSLGGAFAIQGLINRRLGETLFAAHGGVPCDISLSLALAAFAAILLISVVPALGIGVHYSTLEPANEIRET
ncbi:FtsX-like permease family protein [Rhodospirillum sp. A1_3_36]|uniref:FtsX-like permease family protein n=1 Tax=Rhodospirillum sp. A1_3_36 TaxID=3391666 RepID=UPI0039A6F64C